MGPSRAGHLASVARIQSWTAVAIQLTQREPTVTQKMAGWAVLSCPQHTRVDRPKSPPVFPTLGSQAGRQPA